MNFWSLSGLTRYEAVRELQLALVDLRARDLIADTVLFIEHEPVITRGRGLQFTGAPGPRQMPLPGALPAEVSFAESERGGDLTYHGPGQLVVYPICKLDGRGFGPHHDVAAFLRRFEQVFIDVVTELGKGRVQAVARENATGVWVRMPEGLRSHGMAETGGYGNADKKLASMGIAVRRWVVYHGLAINCVNDLEPFRLISPCGYSPDVMTRLSDLLGSESEEARTLLDWERRGRADLERRLADRIEASSFDPAIRAVRAIRTMTLEGAWATARAAEVPVP